MASDSNPDVVIQKLLKEGKYYENAFAHYYAKYAINFNHRLWLMILITYVFILIAIVSTNVYLLFPLQWKVPFVQYTDNMYEDLPQIKSMYSMLIANDNAKDSIQDLVSKYLLQNYIKIREVYSDQGLEYQNLYIKNNSSYKVYNEYYKHITLINDVEKAKKRFAIDVTSIKLLESNSLIREAVASFVATDYENKILFKSGVKISFRFSDVLLAHRGLIPLEFMVVNYEKF